MSLFKWLAKKRDEEKVERKSILPLGALIEKQLNEDESIESIVDDMKIVYLAASKPNENLIATLKSINHDQLQTFETEASCLEYVTATSTVKLFLVVDAPPSSTLLESLESLSQIDSLFVYTPTESTENPVQHTYFMTWCKDDISLRHAIQKSHEELDKQTAAFSMYNRKEKATRDLTKESGSFLFFQLFKNVLKNMPKTAEAKKTMIATCRDYYRGNIIELKNIDEFEKTYKSTEAIQWYTKESFVYKFINKALRTEDVEVLYQFRFYIMDLSEQLELKFLQLKSEQHDILHLYRGLKLSKDEVASFQANIGNLISTNGYLSTSSSHSVAYGFATKSATREGVVRALFEYQVDLNVVEKIVIADIAQYSAFPEEAEMLVDIGASFQIDSCTFDADADLWHITVHATDQGATLASEYLEYQKQKMVECDIVLMFGNLLLEMGEYGKAKKYFDAILGSSKPNDEEIACIYFNFGRAHRLKGEFMQAIKFYLRAYDLHMGSKPKRLASAGKTLNGLGVVYSELGEHKKAEAHFKEAMQLYNKSIPGQHVDVAGTLMNLGTIYSDQKRYILALKQYNKAKKIYERSLPPGHPNMALLLANVGNVHFSCMAFDLARTHYEDALKLQVISLPSDHPDIARTLHNLAVVHTVLGHYDEADDYLKRATETASRTLPTNHPFMSLVDVSRNYLVDTFKDYATTQF